MSAADRVYNVLFLCTGNSARSVLGEAVLNHIGRGQFHGFSAGSTPKGAIHPMTLETLSAAGIPTDGLRSKSWEEFAAPGAPQMDFVFTVCDNAAGETCPIWPGHPTKAHWGIEDPAAVKGDDAARRHAVHTALQLLNRRISVFINLPFAKLDKMALKQEVDSIGRLREQGQ